MNWQTIRKSTILLCMLGSKKETAHCARAISLQSSRERLPKTPVYARRKSSTSKFCHGADRASRENMGVGLMMLHQLFIVIHENFGVFIVQCRVAFFEPFCPRFSNSNESTFQEARVEKHAVEWVNKKRWTEGFIQYSWLKRTYRKAHANTYTHTLYLLVKFAQLLCSNIERQLSLFLGIFDCSRNHVLMSLHKKNTAMSRLFRIRDGLQTHQEKCDLLRCREEPSINSVKCDGWRVERIETEN